MNKLNNKEIINDINKHLTGNNQLDVKYLNMQLAKYTKEKNEEVVYELFSMIYKRLNPEVLKKINSQVEDEREKRLLEFSEAIKLFNNKEYTKSKEILLRLIELYEKVFYMQKKLNYYDFGEKIEGFIFCETPEKMNQMKIKFFPEPVASYFYYLGKIHHEEKDDLAASIALEKSLSFNPRSISNMLYLALLYNNLNKKEQAFELLKEVLKYAYRKDQIATAYNLIGKYYQENKMYDIAIGCYLISNFYSNDDDNFNSIMEITNEVGVIKFNNPEEIIDTFKKYNLQHGISQKVIVIINEFIMDSINKKSYGVAEYLLKIAFELTNNNEYNIQLNKIKGVKNEIR